MKRTINVSKELNEYIEQMKVKGQPPSATINKLFDYYKKEKIKTDIKSVE